MPKNVVFDSKTKRLGQLIDSEGSQLARFEAAGKFEPIKTGRDYLPIRFPSLTMFRRVAPDYLESLFTNSPDELVFLAISQLDLEDAYSNNIKKVIREDKFAADFNLSKVRASLKRLINDRRVAVDSELKGEHYFILDHKSLLLPEVLEWIREFPEDTNGNTEDQKPDKPQKKTPAEKDSKSEARDRTSSVVNGPIEIFRLQLEGKKPPTPNEYQEWLAEPWAAAKEVLASIKADGIISIAKAKEIHYPLIALLGADAFKAKEDKEVFEIAFASSAIGMISSDFASEIFDLPWFPSKLNSTCNSRGIDFSSYSAADILNSALSIHRQFGPESAPAANVRTHIISDSAFDKKFRSERKASPEQLVGQLTQLVTILPIEFQRIELGLKLIRDFHIELPFTDLLSGANIETLEGFLKDAFPLEKTNRSALLEASRLQVNEILSKPSSSETIFGILGLVEKYGLEVEPKTFGTALKRSLQASPKTRKLVAGLSNDEQLAATEFELSELRKQIEIVTRQLEELTSISANDKAQIARLTSVATESRKEHEESILSDIRSAKIPVIKAMARALSASIELLDSKPSAISRLEMMAEQVNLFTIGKPGEEVEFSKALHEDPEGSLEIGSQGVVHNVGFRWQDDGKEVIVLRAVVTSK